VADSNGQQNRKPEEPDARNGRVQICGGAFGGIRGATRQPGSLPPPSAAPIGIGEIAVVRSAVFQLDSAMGKGFKRALSFGCTLQLLVQTLKKVGARTRAS
jgi:hypothetical protein